MVSEAEIERLRREADTIMTRIQRVDEALERARQEAGDHLLRFLGEQEGRLNALRHLPDGRTVAERLARGGPDYPRMTAEELGMEFEYVRHLYRALRRVGLVTTYEGSTIKGSERKLKPKDETHRKHTYYVTTSVAEECLRELAD